VPFQDPHATLHLPNTVPPTLLLQTPTPTPLQQQVYQSFATATADRQLAASTAAAAGGSPYDARFRAWLGKLKAFTDAHPKTAYHNLTDDPEQTALVDEVLTLAKEVNDPLQTQHIALQLFQCAPLGTSSPPAPFKL
jgi:hypothetical protein